MAHQAILEARRKRDEMLVAHALVCRVESTQPTRRLRGLPGKSQWWQCGGREAGRFGAMFLELLLLIGCGIWGKERKWWWPLGFSFGKPIGGSG